MRGEIWAVGLAIAFALIAAWPLSNAIERWMWGYGDADQPDASKEDQEDGTR